MKLGDMEVRKKLGQEGLGALVYATQGDCEIDPLLLFALGAVLLEPVEMDSIQRFPSLAGQQNHLES